jgi:hypothetical protein
VSETFFKGPSEALHAAGEIPDNRRNLPLTCLRKFELAMICSLEHDPAMSASAAALSLFPATIAGSLPKPRWLAAPNRL